MKKYIEMVSYSHMVHNSHMCSIFVTTFQEPPTMFHVPPIPREAETSTETTKPLAASGADIQKW